MFIMNRHDDDGDDNDDVKDDDDGGDDNDDDDDDDDDDYGDDDDYDDDINTNHMIRSHQRTNRTLWVLLQSGCYSRSRVINLMTSLSIEHFL